MPVDKLWESKLAFVFDGCIYRSVNHQLKSIGHENHSAKSMSTKMNAQSKSIIVSFVLSEPITKSIWETLKLLYPIALAYTVNTSTHSHSHSYQWTKYSSLRLSPFFHLAVKQRHKSFLIRTLLQHIFFLFSFSIVCL